jgi:hypothetical protein
MDYASLKKAVNDTANITGGALDYVIANAADLSVESGWYPIGVLYVDLFYGRAKNDTNSMNETGATNPKILSRPC